MPLTERRMRWEAMMEKLRGSTIQQWFADFVDALQETPDRQERDRADRDRAAGAMAGSLGAIRRAVSLIEVPLSKGDA